MAALLKSASEDNEGNDYAGKVSYDRKGTRESGNVFLRKSVIREIIVKLTIRRPKPTNEPSLI